MIQYTIEKGIVTMGQLPIELVGVFSGFVGVLLGGIVQYKLNKLADRRRERREQLLSEYAGLLAAIHRLSAAQISRSNTTDAQSSFEFAKTQFLLHGSASAVRLFAQWLKEFGTFDSNESIMNYSKLINQMRADCFYSQSGIDEYDVQHIMFPTGSGA